MTINDTTSTVRVDGSISQKFFINQGLHQGDEMSAIFSM